MAYPIGKLTLHRALGTNCTSTEGLYNKMQTYAKLFTYLFRKFLAPEYSLQSVKHCDCSQLTVCFKSHLKTYFFNRSYS